MSNSKEGWLKIKKQDQTKWHRRYCIIDWDKSVLFIASKVDTRYRDWIKLLPSIIINDFEYSFNNESNNNNNLSINTIEIIVDYGKSTHHLQAETKKDYDNWLLALKQTAYSRVGGGIFGQSLQDTYRYSQDKTSLVPLIVRQCCEYLLEHGLTFVGLFRVPGKQSTIKELRDMYDRGLPVELKACYSPATISSLLKTYLQSLPEPIIPIHCFDEFLAIGSRFKYSQTNDLYRLKQLIETNLTNINHAILAYLCIFLKKVTDHAQITKMDTDNLAVVFGNNLIRPAEDLDLNMLKGHSFNLLPLIKVLIDYSEYLFSNTSTNQFHDSYEPTNESITKSSGFSSFSSLLSSNDHLLSTKLRSTSLPSLYKGTFSSFDSANISLESQLELDDIKQQRKSSIEKQYYVTSDHNDNQQSSLDTNQINYATVQNKIDFFENKSNIQQKRFASTELLNTDNDDEERIKHNPRSMNNILTQRKQKIDKTPRPVTTINTGVPTRKMEKAPSKKSLANKFGKSLSNLKLTMSKALQPHISLNDNESQIIDSSTSSANQQIRKKSLDNQLSNNLVKRLQNDIDILKELLDKKELLINELTEKSCEEHLKFDEEKFQLNQKIEQLQYENMQLKKQLNMQ
ncbi:unnamed protein product [Rotaria sp. Silwood1]|nr:unnamed protein product [Rotaria sp. Silwood1]CAF1206881.1 unnamed protein product [Rotaria sp. Silwood1]CAF3484701.1 unnamed protein product [Rotaria sp. Silwood1]CAF3534472.1 unnamed protein product [Rotaria sp. Silwood1]CAF4642083.1 unnamed protein product [Rotaria sp. Silwood1]